MPPHCDTMDGPVVTAAKAALEKGNVNLILPWAPKKAEEELKKGFERTLRMRKLGKDAKELANYWFFETIVRLHREGEGAPYTGLKPAGLDQGPVVPRVEEAIEKGDAREYVEAMLEVTLYSHHLYEYIKGGGVHAAAGKPEHGHEHTG